MTVDEIEKRLYGDICYQAVAKLIRYEAAYYSVMRPKIAELVKQYGEARVREAERHVLQQTPSTGSDWLVQLNPKLRVRARMLLGPLPEELATWNVGLPESQHRHAPTAVSEPPRAIVEELSPEEAMLRAIPQRMLADRLHFAREQSAFYKADSEEGRQTAAEIAKLEGEFSRRGLVCPITPVKAKPARKKAA